ncbi:MerR family transcriptional regulator [Paenibacillus daejeonensis]|uniref:MerR family transcriptional regulator n=1 Tax=Paenibacillus daejeonensis TaxID=135193 RepID=UPI000380283E|nr:MerR family transcriptional regulator [Paenibacillus daejeonensis]
MEITIGQFAKLVGSTVRTVRYYDKIGLLTPTKINKSGRKVYTRSDIDLFQQIMILKHFGLSLDEITEQMTNEALKNRELMQIQKQLIEEKQAELNDMLEVITRMDRLYRVEGINEEELDEYAFIMLDLFRREKKQIQAFKKYFHADEQLMEELERLHDPVYKEKMDLHVWHLLQAIRHAIQHDDPASRDKVRQIIDDMNQMFPASRNFLELVENEQFLETYTDEFNNYFPEDIASYLLKEIKMYYQD